MADMNGPRFGSRSATYALDEDIVRAVTETANDQIADFTKRMSADFQAAAAVLHPWQVNDALYGEYDAGY
jgi:hypothetical protein